MKLKTTFFIISLALAFSSCSLKYYRSGVHSDMKKIQLGMDKDEVIRIMGKHFINSAASKDEQGNKIEVISYSSNWTLEYNLRFVNGKLTEWEKERIYEYKVVEPQKVK
jgi:hypothetical protein